MAWLYCIDQGRHLPDPRPCRPTVGTHPQRPPSAAGSNSPQETVEGGVAQVAGA